MKPVYKRLILTLLISIIFGQLVSRAFFGGDSWYGAGAGLMMFLFLEFLEQLVQMLVEAIQPTNRKNHHEITKPTEQPSNKRPVACKP